MEVKERALNNIWDSKESAMKWFHLSINRDDCMYANVSRIVSDGAGHFDEINGRDLVIQYTKGIGIEGMDESK